MTGTLINVGTVLLGTLIGSLAGGRLPEGVQRRVLMGLGMVTLVLGIDNALVWREDSKNLILIVMFAVLVGGIIGELLRIEERLSGLGDRLQARFEQRGGGATGASESTVSQAFFTATLLFCVGPLTVLGSIDDGLRGDIELLTTKAVLDGFASVALAAALGPGVALAAVSVLVIQGGITLGAGLFEDILVGLPLEALTSAGGVLIIGIALKLLDVKDVKVGNYLPALLVAPVLAAIVDAV
ncbi:MAG TPA: DUF554 domain-containing protein [Solirubrobacteraceae bacterium]|nr:DUF554 domain-containing protein [Solirubrobacteraceae bacterium]